jgi:hypothetical protein
VAEVCSWLKRTSFSSVAEYSFTGIETIPKLIAPFQIGRGISHLLPSRQTPVKRRRSDNSTLSVEIRQQCVMLGSEAGKPATP